MTQANQLEIGRFSSVLILLVGLACPFCLAADAPAGFTDITRGSGVAQLLDDKYRADPKWWLSGVDLVDLDGDGHLDLFLGSHGGGKAVAALNDGQGHFTLAGGTYPDREIYLAADINEDGKLDLLVTHQDGAGRWWINHSEKGKLAFVKTEVGMDRARANALIDFDRNGRVDWLHENGNGVAFEKGDGKGAFFDGPQIKIGRMKNETNMIPVDLNGDGFIDIIVHWGRYELEKGKSRIYLNDGKGNFKDATTECGLAEDNLAIKGVGDLNQDGSTDLLVLENKRSVIYFNDGKGHFTRKPEALVGMEAAHMPAYASWGMAVMTDFDNDGVPDVLWNGRNFLWVLHGLGDGKFEYANKKWGIDDTASATVDDGLCFGDLDGDGDLDIIGYTGNIDGQRRLKVYRNDLAGANHLTVRLNGGDGNRGAAGAKIRVKENGKLIWFEQVLNVGSQSAHSYYLTPVTERHIGLGGRKSADVSVEFYPSGKIVEQKVATGVIDLAE